MAEVLGLMAKWPAPGQVKTRLGVAPARAAAVARAFLDDTLRRCAALADQRFLVYVPDGARSEFTALPIRGYEAIVQGDGDLGQRLERFFAGRFSAGADRVVVLGCDSPTLPIAYIEQAFRQLREVDVVLGPATDGGYYLLGCRRLPPIFADIPWSGPTVLAATVARLAEPSWSLAVLPPWYDVDTPESWSMLVGHVAALRRAGLDPGIPATEALLESAS